MQTTTHARRFFFAATALLASAAVAAPALAAPSGSFKGKTSQDEKVSFKVVGKKVKRFRFEYEAPCNDGRKLTGSFTFNPVPLDGRRFAVKGSSTGELPDGTPTTSNLKLTGKFNKAERRATGTISISTELPNATGDGVATCRTGKLTYSAKKRKTPAP